MIKEYFIILKDNTYVIAYTEDDDACCIKANVDMLYGDNVSTITMDVELTKDLKLIKTLVI